MPERDDKRVEREEESDRKSRKLRENSFHESEDERKHSKSKRKTRESSDSDGEDVKHEKSQRRKRKSRRRYSSGEETSSGSESEYSDSEDSGTESESETKRPEFTAWLAEVKQVNLESLPNWEEKQMFKEFMEDHNTATFPSKKYYSLDAHFRHQLEKEMKKGFKKVQEKERTVFNDEEIRRQEMMIVREKQKEEEVAALKRSMQGGMAQAMKEQAQLREEMAYQYKVGNMEAAAAIQRRLDPDVAM
uniref:Nucleic acid binding protein n=1 Tax=Cannabis sativa TaxID=3483 RepID=A0A803NX45_CANSA